jgi:hypothetical protein
MLVALDMLLPSSIIIQSMRSEQLFQPPFTGTVHVVKLFCSSPAFPRLALDNGEAESNFSSE